MNLKKIGKVLTSKSVGTGPSSYTKRIYRAADSQRSRNTGLGYVLSQDGKFFSSVQTGLLLNVYWECFPRDGSGRCVKLTTHLLCDRV